MILKFCNIYFLFFIFIVHFFDLHARYSTQYAPFKVPEYQLIDLGETTLSKRVLSRQCWPLSLAPRINNKGQVIGNLEDRSFIWEKRRGFFYFCKQGLLTNFVDINNHGTILGRVYDIDGYSEWFVWSENQCKRDTLPTYLSTECLYGEDLFLRAINDSGQVVGSRRMNGNCYRSIFWNDKKKMMEISFGTLLDINNKNNIIGVELENRFEKPFLWHIKGGKSIVSDNLLHCKKEAVLKFGFPVIADDNSVYGTYLLSKGGKNYCYVYLWNSEDECFKTLNLNDMRVSAVNRSHTLVGKCGNDAALSINHFFPKKLIHLIKKRPIGWKFIEATDINDLGQIVGYGTFFGKTHLFMLDPVHD